MHSERLLIRIVNSKSALTSKTWKPLKENKKLILVLPRFQKLCWKQKKENSCQDQRLDQTKMLSWHIEMKLVSTVNLVSSIFWSKLKLKRDGEISKSHQMDEIYFFPSYSLLKKSFFFHHMLCLKIPFFHHIHNFPFFYT